MSTNSLLHRSHTATPDTSQHPARASWMRHPAALAVIAVVTMFGASLSPVLISLLAQALKVGNDSPMAVQVAMMVLMCVTATVVALGLISGLGKVLTRQRLRDMGVVFTRGSLPAFGAGVAVAAVALLPVAVTMKYTGLAPTLPVQHLDVTLLIATIVVLICRAVLLQGFPEELVWRGWFMTALRHRPYLALTVSSLVFGLMHLISSGGQQNALDHVLYLAAPTGFAFAGGALALLLRSLWAAVGVHAGFHLVNGFIVEMGLQVKPPVWASVPTGVLFLIVGLALVRMARARGIAEVVYDR